MKLLVLFWFRTGLLSVVSNNDVLLVDAQELLDSKELAEQFRWFEVAWRLDLTAESIPDLVSCLETAWLFSGLYGMTLSR